MDKGEEDEKSDGIGIENCDLSRSVRTRASMTHLTPGV